jgi:hypothetical protein
MFVIRLPRRKPITSVTNDELDKILEPYYGSDKNGGYFIGAGFGAGWNDIVLDLHNKLVKEHPEYYIIQIKEKFGTLRFYTGGMTDAGWNLIGEAEDLSAATCEDCGRPGELDQSSSWIVTSCKWDKRISKISMLIWRWQRYPFHLYWKIRFAINRWRRKKGLTNI